MITRHDLVKNYEEKNQVERNELLEPLFQNNAEKDIVGFLHKCIDFDCFATFWSSILILSKKNTFPQIMAATVDGQTLLHRMAKKFAEPGLDYLSRTQWYELCEEICKYLLGIENVNPFAIYEDQDSKKWMAIDYIFQWIKEDEMRANPEILQLFLDNYLGLGLHWEDFPAQKFKTENRFMVGYIKATNLIDGMQNHLQTPEQLEKLSKEEQKKIVLRLNQFLASQEVELDFKNEIYSYLDKLQTILKEEYQEPLLLTGEKYIEFTTQPVDIGEDEFNFAEKEASQTEEINRLNNEAAAPEIEIEIDIDTTDTRKFSQEEIDRYFSDLIQYLHDMRKNIELERSTVEGVARRLHVPMDYSSPNNSRTCESFLLTFLIYNMLLVSAYLTVSSAELESDSYSILDADQWHKILILGFFIDIALTVTMITIAALFQTNKILHKHYSQKNQHILNNIGLNLTQIQENFPEIKALINKSADPLKVIDLLISLLEAENKLCYRQTRGHFFPGPTEIINNCQWKQKKACPDENRIVLDENNEGMDIGLNV